MAPAPVADQNGIDPADVIGKAPPGVILPPKEIRHVLEKTVGYVARGGASFEDRIRSTIKDNPKLSFLSDNDPYNAYYLWRLEEYKEGRGTSIATGQEGAIPAPAKQEKKGPEAPKEFQFSARMPTINAVDLEIVKLTALFVAKNGRGWMTQLAQRENRNYQFDFLRPQHSFYQFFSRLVDQYTSLLNGASADERRLQKERIKELEHNVENKYHILDRARQRAEWVKYQEAQKVKKEEDEKVEQLAYAQIDWHDFSVVETIVFNEADDQIDLPPPTSLNDLQSASLEQKAQMSLARPDMRIEEAMPGMDDYYPPSQYQPTPQPAQAPIPMPYSPQPPPASASPAQAAPYAPPRTAQQMEEDARIAARAADRERAQQAQAAAMGTGPMRIRNDYVPRAQARRQNVNMAICPNCKQQFPAEEMAEHLRIEMLDPRWREQSRIAAQRSSTTNLSHIDMANNLKRLASKRSDVFDPATGRPLDVEEAERLKRITPNPGDVPQGVAGGAGGQGQGQSADVSEQIRNIHQRYGQR